MIRRRLGMIVLLTVILSGWAVTLSNIKKVDMVNDPMSVVLLVALCILTVFLVLALFLVDHDLLR